MRLNDVPRTQAMLCQQLLDAIDVALRVHDERAPPVVDDVAAISEAGRVKRENVQATASGHVLNLLAARR
ncbi:MAG: hypothetical protein ACKOMX_07095 [Actinomycetota bacterium]